MDNRQTANPKVTVEDVERVLAVGRLLLSVLTPEEIEDLRETLATGTGQSPRTGRRREKQVTLASLDAGADIS